MHMDMRMIRITKRKKQKGPERTFCTLLLFSFCHADHAHNPHNADVSACSHTSTRSATVWPTLFCTYCQNPVLAITGKGSL